VARRNVRKLALRPALPRRGIVWIPSLAPERAAERVARFRDRFDPHAARIAPHVSLVFPFPTTLTATQVASHVKRVTAGWPVLPVSFRGVESIQNRFAVLMCDLRAAAITELHDRLYSGVLAGHLREDLEYQPHITLGSTDQPGAFDEMLAEAELYFRDSITATCRELNVVRYGDDGTITSEATVPLSRT
jgi:2'-5' RNA ligase